MTSPAPTARSHSVVTNNKVPKKDMGVSRRPIPPTPTVSVEIRSSSPLHQPRVKSYHMGWAQVVEELSWKLNGVSGFPHDKCIVTNLFEIFNVFSLLITHTRVERCIRSPCIPVLFST